MSGGAGGVGREWLAPEPASRTQRLFAHASSLQTGGTLAVHGAHLDGLVAQLLDLLIVLASAALVALVPVLFVSLFVFGALLAHAASSFVPLFSHRSSGVRSRVSSETNPMETQCRK